MKKIYFYINIFLFLMNSFNLFSSQIFIKSENQQPKFIIMSSCYECVKEGESIIKIIISSVLPTGKTIQDYIVDLKKIAQQEMEKFKKDEVNLLYYEMPKNILIFIDLPKKVVISINQKEIQDSRGKFSPVRLIRTISADKGQTILLKFKRKKLNE